MVRLLQFLLSLDSQPLSPMNYLRARCLCCASVSLRILVTLYWRVLGVPWPPFCQIQLPWIFSQRLRSVFYRSSQERLLGVSLVWFDALPENIMGSPLLAFFYIFFFGEIIFAGRAPWPREPLGTGFLVLDRAISLPSLPLSAWRTDWSTKGACRTWQAWYYCCRDFFWSLDRMRRLEVL